MDTDRIEGKRKEAKGQLQQKWGRAKDEARKRWERLDGRMKDADGTEDDELEDQTARSSAAR